MAITFTATAEPANEPPRVRLDLASNDPATVFDTIEIRRDGQVIRSIPPTGSAVSVVYDYDAPFGLVSHYSVSGTTKNLGTVFSTAWPNLTGWTTTGGAPGVASARFRTTVAGESSVGRAVAIPADGRLTFTADWFADGVIPPPGATGGQVVIGGTIATEVGSIVLYNNGAGPWGVAFATSTGFTAPVYVPGGSGLGVTLTWTADGTITLTSPGGSLTVTNPAGGPTIGQVAVITEPGNQIPGFTISNLGTPVAFTGADSATLNADEAWLIHPISPDLSVRVSTATEGGRHDRLYVERDSAAQVTYPAQRQLFAPLGRSRQVPVTYGNRRDGEWSLVLRTPRTEDRAAVRSILVDQSPLLIRFPPSFPWDLDDGWYSVGDVTDDRLLDSSTRNIRSMTLPLDPCDEPVLTQGAEWTYGDDLILHPTYTDSLIAFPTYLDRLVGPQV